MTAIETVYTLACPACGGRIHCKAAPATVTCAWCGSTVVVTGTAAAPRAFAQEEETPLAARIERLLRDGHDGRAVQLLRDELALPLQDAGRVVERIRLNECQGAAQVIQDAQDGKLK
jgi:hypothetical protein